MVLKPTDCTQTYTQSDGRWSVNVTHVPTGRVVCTSGPTYKDAYDEAIGILSAQMSEGGSQPAPIPNDLPSMHDLVAQDMATRKNEGFMKYGCLLQPHNGRDALRDAYEEALDGAAYLRQALYERDGE